MRDSVSKVMTLLLVALALLQAGLACHAPRSETPKRHISTVVGNLRFIEVQTPAGTGALTASKLDGSRTGYYWDLGERAGELRPQAQRVVMLGLGGGEMLRAARRTLPKADLLGVDNDPEMLRAAVEEFHIDDFGARGELADAFEYVKSLREVDVLLVDLFLGDTMPPAMFLPQFWRDCHAALSGHGLLAVNVYPESMVSPISVLLEAQGVKVTEKREVHGSTVLFGEL